MPPRLRKLVLTAHVVASVGWLGIDVALLTLGVTGLATHEPEVLRAAYVAMGLFGAFLIVPVSLGALVTGLVLSLGTRWRLLRHYWVLAKFALTAAATAAVILALRPRLGEAATRALNVPLGALATGGVGDSSVTLVAAPGVALLALSTATVLSVYKPWGRTPYGRRQAARRAAGSPSVR